MFSKSTRILIVDDMAAMRRSIRRALHDLGFTTVIDADDGMTAWVEIEASLAKQEPFQLIISDWNMPKMQGIELLKRVRGNESMKDIPFIMLTAEQEKAQVVQAVQFGVSNYIIKPFTPATLAEKLMAVFESMDRRSREHTFN